MFKVDVPQILISSAAIFGIGLVWLKFNERVFDTVLDLLSAPFIDKGSENEEDEKDEEDEEDK